MKKITFFSVCLFFTITGVVAQKKQAPAKTNPTKSTAVAPAATKEVKAESEKAPQLDPAKTETKKMESNPSLSQADISVGTNGTNRGTMPFEEVYAMYKEKVDGIESEIAAKKEGIQKDAALSKEDKQKKIDEYNAYRTQMLKDVFGEKNFEIYNQTIKH